MKILLLAVPLLAGAAVAGTSHYAGSRTESEYQELLQQLNKLSPLTLVNDTYESGLGSSTAITRVMGGSGASAEVLFRLQHDIQHASLRMNDDGLRLGTVSIHTRLHDKDSFPEEVRAAFTEENIMSLMTDVGLDGEIKNSFTLSGFEVSDIGETISASGMTFDTVTQGEKTVGSGTFGSSSYNDKDSGVSISIEDSPFAIDVLAHGDNIFTGTGEVIFSNVNAMNPETMPSSVNISSISIDAKADREGDVISSISSLDLTGIDAPIPLKNASLDIELQEILIEGLRQYTTLLQSINSDPEAFVADQDFTKKLAAAVRAMFKSGSALNYTVQLANDEGDVDANIRIGIKEADVEGFSEDALNNITNGRDLLNVLSVKGQLNADTAALAQTPVMMMLSEAGEFLTVTDESITSNVELMGTTLVVNGVELPLDIMLGGTLDVPFSALFQM